MPREAPCRRLASAAPGRSTPPSRTVPRRGP
jgi:hypothetical protein